MISDDGLLVPEGPRPAHSVPAHTHTPYPNILNPIDDPQTSMLSSEAQNCSHEEQKQQQDAHNSSKKFVYDASQQSQRTQESLQHHVSHLDSPAETSHFESGCGSNSETDFYAFSDYLLATFGLESIALPGWYVASFDEQNLSPDEGAAEDKDHIEGGNDNR